MDFDIEWMFYCSCIIEELEFSWSTFKTEIIV